MKEFIATVQVQASIKAGKNAEAVADVRRDEGHGAPTRWSNRIKKAGAPPGAGITQRLPLR